MVIGIAGGAFSKVSREIDNLITDTLMSSCFRRQYHVLLEISRGRAKAESSHRV